MSEFPAVLSGLERTARITADGVDVDIRRLTIAANAIRDNIKFAGQRYSTAPDEMILLDIEDALTEHEGKSVSPVSKAAVLEASPASQIVGPVQSLQRNEATKPPNDTEVQREPSQPLTAKPYSGTSSPVAKRINAGLENSPIPYGPVVNISVADRADLPDPPAGHEWWSDGSGGFEAMPKMNEPPDIECAQREANAASPRLSAIE